MPGAFSYYAFAELNSGNSFPERCAENLCSLYYADPVRDYHLGGIHGFVKLGSIDAVLHDLGIGRKYRGLLTVGETLPNVLCRAVEGGVEKIHAADIYLFHKNSLTTRMHSTSLGVLCKA